MKPVAWKNGVMKTHLMESFFYFGDPERTAEAAHTLVKYLADDLTDPERNRNVRSIFLSLNGRVFSLHAPSPKCLHFDLLSQLCYGF